MADSVNSIVKAVTILRCFSADSVELSAAEIGRRVSFPKSTTHRLLDTLAKTGLLERSRSSGKYSIGPTLYTMGSLYLSAADLLKAADPVIKTLNELTNEAVNLGILDKGNLVLVMKEESKHVFRFSHRIGSVLLAYATSMGKALLSELADDEIDRVYPEQLRPMTSKTIATRTELKKELAKIRNTGIAIDHQGSYEGVEGIASVVRDASGKAVAGMSIAVPIFRLNPTRRERLAQLVKMGAGLISYRMGYRDTHNKVHDISAISAWWEQFKDGV
jgi:IclR family KDG regulon transcriptional repressor